ncbi:MAG: cytochrome c biogenesis protein DipZ [Actinomycetes bacterium]
MLVLLGIGFLAGMVTAVSPCVLPVLPVLLAGGATGRRPLRIIAGLTASFVLFTLFASWLLGTLGLPPDLLRNAAIALLLVLAATLLVPKLGLLLERPFARLTRFRSGGGGFVLGASLGLVFVPCAGPVLAAVTVVAASNHVGWRAGALTAAYALGAALPMLAIAIGGRGIATRLRSQAPVLRLGSGIAIGGVAIGLAFNLDGRFQTALPGYTSAFQQRIEGSSVAQKQLAQVTGSTPLHATTTAGSLPDYGVAPALHPGGDWINSPPLTLSGLRGKVVLLDFWTYSCINCLRTLPHVEAWDAAYRKDGLVIIGVHTPEFAFEHVSSNVRAAVERLGVAYPVVQDNAFGTWNAYGNRYWPAEYLIDRAGHVREAHFGEGDYDTTEQSIRTLLGIVGAHAEAVPELLPDGPRTPESYLGYVRIDRGRYVGSHLVPNHVVSYRSPVSPTLNSFGYTGRWRVERQRIVAVASAGLTLHFRARDVYLVLGGRGTVDVQIAGEPVHAVTVDSVRLYTVSSSEATRSAIAHLRFTPGVQAYAFTFG